MKDINTLTGIEFENLCQGLLQKAGFDVETTKASGDGGIDLIAHNRQSFFSGKYIVQCKRYAGSVGEPIIRDLYGVVMAERANKGILITTGYFTASATAFAQDKNIELIDGTKLQELLSIHQGADLTEAKQFFYEDKNFDLDKYLFYKDIVSQKDCSEEIAYDYLQFLFSYMVNNTRPNMYIKDKTGINDRHSYDLQNSEILNINLVHDGLAEEFGRYFDWYIEKFYKRGKKQLLKLPFLVYKYAGVNALYKFDLFEYVQQRYNLFKEEIGLLISYDDRPYYDLDYYRFDYYDVKEDIDQMLKEPDLVHFGKDYRYFELMNLYGLFKYFGIECGKKKIIESLSWSPQDERHIDSKKLLDLFANERTFKMMLNDDRFIILHPVIGESYDVNSRGKEVFSGYDATYRYAVNFTPYYERYASENSEKIQREIAKIMALLST